MILDKRVQHLRLVFHLSATKDRAYGRDTNTGGGGPGREMNTGEPWARDEHPGALGEARTPGALGGRRTHQSVIV